MVKGKDTIRRSFVRIWHSIYEVISDYIIYMAVVQEKISCRG